MSFELALSPASPELRSKVTSGTCPGRPSASPRALRARPAYTAPVRLDFVARGRIRRRLRRGRRLHTGLACAHRTVLEACRMMIDRAVDGHAASGVDVPAGVHLLPRPRWPWLRRGGEPDRSDRAAQWAPSRTSHLIAELERRQAT
eukprot:366476-Chlamydomonas_euryale.AAC.13